MDLSQDSEQQSAVERIVVQEQKVADPRQRRLNTGGHIAENGKSGSAADLDDLLRNRFGHDSFRFRQQEVCKEVIKGRDVLLVMPTGAGKSLCYQLPGIARGGTTLVISPLIALMEDQVAKLQQSGFRAERIHSGRDRNESNQVCMDYLDQNLDFLFIAPERLSVPGFPELLSRIKPALVAIDEAHCISMWGHDFRPDYRRIGGRLPILRPVPVIAMTATATPRVQQDIVAQLQLVDFVPAISGFRRDNLSIEFVQMTPSRRIQCLTELLRDDARRPAIVYARTRKEADDFAEQLQAEFLAAAYHAGMNSETRDSTQVSFQRGQLDVIVATIAFGMGIDKPDVRTVVHTGLPRSIEGYYQEIGRAGRDGLLSKVVLLHSWADRKMHEYFLDKDYPEPSELDRIFRILTDTPRSLQELADQLGQEMEDFERRIEKLWVHGGARIDPDENAVRGDGKWRSSYERQRNYKIAQLELVSAFTSSHNCRMLDLVQHFGDTEDSLQPCGICDICNPSACIVLQFRDLSVHESEVVKRVEDTLRAVDSQSVGKLFRDWIEPMGLERKEYERLVAGLVRAGLARITRDSFEKDGKVIEYLRIRMTDKGLANHQPLHQVVKVVADLQKPRKGTGSSSSGKKAKKNLEKAEGQFGLTRKSLASGEEETLVTALKAWRKDVAQKRKIPAFRIFQDRALNSLVDRMPGNKEQLLDVVGIGPAFVNKYGDKILKIIRSASNEP